MAPKTTHVAVAAVAVFVAFAGWLLGRWSHPDTVQIIDDVALGVLVVPAVVFATHSARSARGRRRAAWVALIVGLCGWFIGEVIWTCYELLGQAPFPSVADVGFLLLPAAACVALLLFPDDYSTFSVGRAFLDGLIVAGSLFLVSWVTVLRPYYEGGPQDRLGFIVSIAYPVSDVVILTVAAIVVMRAQTNQRLVLTLLAVGFACIAVADSGFVFLQNTGRYASGNMIDIGWAAGFLLITVAGAAGRVDEGRSASQQLPGWASAWLPYAPLLLAGLVAAAEPLRVLESAPVAVVAALLVVAVLGRQLLAISENQRLLAQVADQARHDPLTGLANRILLHERLEQAMRLRDRDGLSVGVLSLDLDDFKRINDTFGHQAGDELLIDVADRLTGCVRAGDTVARLGGDEFVVLIEDSAEQSYLVADRVLRAFDEPMWIEGHKVTVLPSAGLAIAGADDPDLSVGELLRRADAAMYASKSAPTREVQTFSAQMRFPGTHNGVGGRDVGGRDLRGRVPNRSAPADGAAEPELLGELREAITQSQLTLHYQPQFDLATAQIVGVEGLIRWQHPTRGLLGPEEFLPLVRRYRLMESVNDFVVNRALTDTQVWHAASVDVPVAVNLFAPTLANLELPATIARALAGRGLSAQALIIEITEHMLVENLEHTQTVLRQLRHTGVRVAFDDFGSGYSTLSYLRDLPFDQLKLDRDFISPILGNERAAAVVHGVVELAHNLGAIVVAEGVEDADTAGRLYEFGCDVAQGYFYSPPLTSSALLDKFTAVRPDDLIGATRLTPNGEGAADG